MNKKQKFKPGCFPRKLKKGWNTQWFTKHSILERLAMVKSKREELELKYGNDLGIDKEIEWLNERLKHPKRVTKWTRKAERIHKQIVERNMELLRERNRLVILNDIAIRNAVKEHLKQCNDD